mgnify:CR=1 FL=1
MSYPYPKYNDDTNVEAHVCAFVTTWQENYVSQRLSEANADKSKISEFRLSLDEQSANWYSQHEAGEFESFKQITTKFIRLFHRQVPKRELMSQFYVAYQEAHEIVPQFRFQDIRRQLARTLLKETFLSAL